MTKISWGLVTFLVSVTLFSFYNRNVLYTVETTESVRWIHRNRDTLLVMSITTQEDNPSPKLLNTLRAMSILQQEYSFKGVVFTSSANVTICAESLNLTVIAEVESNPYGLPFLTSIINTSRYLFSASFYGYMNSDILLNPSIIKELTHVQEAIMNGRFHAPLMIGSRVGNIFIHENLIPNLTMEAYWSVISNVSKEVRMRSLTSCDIFIYTPTYPLHSISTAVVGRRWIDYIATSHPHSLGLTLVDISEAGEFEE